MGFDSAEGSKYGNLVGGIFVFNLIVGVGALSLPKGFAAAGVDPDAVRILTMRREAEEDGIISASNSIISDSETSFTSPEYITENTSLLINATVESTGEYSLDKKVEIGQMGELFLGRIGQGLFFFTIILYLMGDLAIYATTIADALAKVTGGWKIGNLVLTDTGAYYVYVLLVLVLIAPLGFLNFNSPYVKYLQFLTMAVRNVALLTMIILSIQKLATHESVPTDKIPLIRPNFPTLFGTAIYAFMCHHSLPGIVTPMKEKLKVMRLLAIDFVIIACVYIILGSLAVSTFGDEIRSLYIYEFKDFKIRPIAVFIQLFPVFTVTSNFPLLTITLRNNMIHLVKIIMGPERVQKSDIMREPPTWFRTLIFTLCGIAPGFFITMFDGRNVTLLVQLTGSYPGLGIMFAFPAILVFFARRLEKKMLFSGTNPYKSWFQSNLWLILIAVWCVVALVMITYDLVVSFLKPGNSGGGH